MSTANNKASEVSDSHKNADKKLSRDDIIESVAYLIAEQGLETLTMRNIAKHVGCSVGTLPHYFEGKDDIVIAALNWSHERIFKRLDSATQNDQPQLDNLYPLISASMPIDEVSDIEWRVRLCLWDYSLHDQEMRLTVNAVASYAEEMLTSIIMQLQAQGVIKASVVASSTALALYHMCIGTGFNMLQQPLDEREKQLTPLYDMIEMIKS